MESSSGNKPDFSLELVNKDNPELKERIIVGWSRGDGRMSFAVGRDLTKERWIQIWDDIQSGQYWCNGTQWNAQPNQPMGFSQQPLVFQPQQPVYMGGGYPPPLGYYPQAGYGQPAYYPQQPSPYPQAPGPRTQGGSAQPPKRRGPEGGASGPGDDDLPF